MVDVFLSDRFIRLVDELSNKRVENSKRCRERKVSGYTNKESHYYGILGEVVYYVLTRHDTNNDVDRVDKYDFVLEDGRTVDVKHTKYKNGSLLIPPHVKEEDMADIYVLVTGKTNPYTVVGYEEKENLKVPKFHDKLKMERRFEYGHNLKNIGELLC